MDWMKQLGGILDQYGSSDPAHPPASVDADFDRATHAVPRDVVRDGLAAAFRSDRTPEFPQMASQMFGRAPASQRAGILNVLLASVGPMVLQQILARRSSGATTPGGQSGSLSGGPGGLGSALGGPGGLGGMLDSILRGGGKPEVTPDIAERIPPDVVEEVAREAEKKDPSIIDRISDVYAQQPELLKVLGGAALAIALGKMAQRKGTL